MADDKTFKDGTGTSYVHALQDISSVFYTKIVGAAAENAAAAGNPLLIAGRYDSSDRTLGNGDVGALALMPNGVVRTVRENSSGAVVDPIPPSTPWHNRDWTTDATEVQVGSGAKTLHWLWAANMTASVCYLQLFNLAPASITLGTTAPLMVFPIPTLTDTNGAGWGLPLGTAGTTFDTALTVAVTTTATGATVVADNAVFLNLGYS